jgi:hypothetical protein
MYCIVLFSSLALIYQNKQKTPFMKKFIFSASVILLMAMVPAVLVGYLHNTDQHKAATEMSGDVSSNSQDNSTLISLVKSF